MKNKMIRITGINKDIEKDHIETGCDPSTHRTVDDIYSYSQAVSRPTFQGILDFLSSTLGLSDNANDYTAFEKGRIIFQRLEDDNGFPLKGAQLEAFNTGKNTAWSATYNIYLEVSVETYEPSVEEMVKDFGVENYG